MHVRASEEKNYLNKRVNMQLFLSLYEGKFLNYIYSKHYVKFFFLVPMREIMQSIVLKMTISKYKITGNLTANLTLLCVGETWLQKFQQIISKMITEENVS